MKTTQQSEALASVKPRPTKKAIIEAAIELARRQHADEQANTLREMRTVKARLVAGFVEAIKADPSSFKVEPACYRFEFECVPVGSLPDKLRTDYERYHALENAKVPFDEARVRKHVTEKLGIGDDHAQMVRRLLDNQATAAALSELIPGGKPTLLID